MAVRKVLAREFTVEVETDTPGSYVAIGGLRTIGFDRGKTDADTTDFDSEGHASHFVAERNRSVTLEGHHLEDSEYGTRDAGQARVEAFMDLVGPASVATFRITSPGGNVQQFDATVAVSGAPAGGHNDPTTWSATLNVTGAVTYA